MLALNDGCGLAGYWEFIPDRGPIIQVKNTIVDSGLAHMAAILIGEVSANSAIYLAWGSGSTATANSDTALGTEVGRKIITQRDRSTSQAIIRTYLPLTEAIGTFTEWGLFFNGTTISGSGTMFNRVLPTGGIAKKTNEGLTVVVRIPFART